MWEGDAGDADAPDTCTPGCAVTGKGNLDFTGSTLTDLRVGP